MILLLVSAVILLFLCAFTTVVWALYQDEKHIEHLSRRLQETEAALDRERSDNYNDFPEDPDPCPWGRFTPHNPSVTYPTALKADWMVPR